MSWISLIWLAFIHLSSTSGNQHGPSAIALDTSIFPADLLTASTGAVEKGSPQKMKLEEDRKTLSQQVADGKYGLIQKELFTKPAQRPGVLSYDSNSEVPKDTANNLGGLNKSDIWLAENHLLVLKGGVFPVLETLPEYSKPAWPPIDDYTAPRRQVKLPKHPKVPPPFPVQLTDGGPLQILGTNFTRTLNDSLISPPYAIPPLEGYEPGNGPFFPPPYPYPANATPGEAPLPAPPYYPPIQGDKPGDDGPPQFPFPVKGGLPPFFDSLPPGSAILPPPNITDQFDEDDLSIYYPPPYSFYYPKDNTTQVPPGPLVPGIVLPPPPDFFGIMKKTSSTTQKSTTTESPRLTRPIMTPPPSTTFVIHKTKKPELYKFDNVTSKSPTEKTKPIYYTIPAHVPELPTNSLPQQPQRNKSINVTVLRPIKTTKKPPTVYIYNSNIPTKPFAEYGPPPRHNNRISITTTKIPLRAYFTTSRETDTNFVTQLPQQEQYTTKSTLQKPRPKPPTHQFYYYDDSPITNSISTPYPVHQPNHYLNLSKEYYTEAKQDPRKYTSNPAIHVQTPLQPQYYYLPSKQYITERPQNRVVQQVQQSFPRNNFKAHIFQLQEQIQSYQRPPKQYNQNLFEIQSQRQDIPSPKPIYQYSFEVANYQQQRERLQLPSFQEQAPQSKFGNVPKYTVQIEPAVEITTTESPIYMHTPAPVYYPDNYQDDSHGPSPPRFYTNNIRNYNYQQPQKYSSVTPHPLNEDDYQVTPDPVYQTYYTKQDEQLFDDITKQYFTTFGKKLATSTTPIPAVEAPSINSQTQVVYSPHEENVRVEPNRQSFTASTNYKSGRVIVDYINQRPTQNLQPEYVPLKQQSSRYPQVTKHIQQYSQPYQPQSFSQGNENYRQKIPQKNINVQTIQAISIPSRDTVGAGKPGSFISYELPGDDGAHFYFLTPQLSQKEDRNGITYYYTQPSGSRIRRDSQRTSV